MLGQVLLGKYKVTRLLDEGGMSKVYIAQQTNPNREVVVKVLKDNLRANSKAVEHFRREIHIMSRFQHENAVAFYDSIPNDPAGPVLIMEYLRGVDLGVLQFRQGKFPPDRAGRLIGQLCEVLDVVHDQGIIHCDIKPGNLMVLNPGSAQESVKLMDFGLAKMLAMLYIAPDELVHPEAPVASGTPEYMSPEQIQGNDLDGRADLYSAGVVLYEMLAGQRPFTATTPTALMRSHLQDDPPTFEELGLGDQIPHAVEAVVRSCLAKLPDDRPKTGYELATRYEQALGKRILPVKSTATPAPMPASPAANGVKAPVAAPPAVNQRLNRNTMQHSIDAVMPEAMAMVKLKGFIHDLGGEVIESVPGMIRVRMGSAPTKKKSGLFGWLERGGTRQSVLEPTNSTTLELRMERRDPSQPNNLTITLLIVPGRGLVTGEWHSQCKKISLDLKAYLMGR